jgi:NADPH:quinone reductase-like Zn-dependent oxidoreductase
MARTLKRRWIVLATLIVALSSLAFWLSYDSACGPAAALPTNAQTMKGVVYRCYGGPEVLKLEDVPKPVPANDEVLVKVRAAGLNPLDWHYMRGTPYIMRMDSGTGAPKDTRFGVDFAGVVEAVGSQVKKFKPGDEVFGAKNGALAEFVSVRESRGIALKPSNISFEQAAAVPIAAITALQGLRDKAHVQPGQAVLINGASGGVGTFAVQIAKSYGAVVTGVCSTRNLDMVRALGADQVIDYTQEDFTAGDKQYDVIVDNVGNHGLLALKRILKPDGVLVIVGGPNGNWLGPLAAPIKAVLLSPFVSQKMGMMLAETSGADLAAIGDLMQTGKVTPVIDRRFSLQEIAEAIRYLETGRARGKVVVNVN